MIPVRLYDYNITQEVNNSVMVQRENLFYFIADKTIAFKGFNNVIDFDFCRKHNIQIVDVNNEGGVIVSGKGSLAVGYISKYIKNTFNADFSKYLIDFLRGKCLDANLVDNDILIDGIHKVASSSTRQFGNVLFSAFHISYEVDLNLIKSLCVKPMNKIPKGLKDYGILDYDIYNLFYDFIKLV